METLQPTLKRGRDVWDPINMPQEEFQLRVEKIRNVMKDESIDLLFLYGYGANGYGNPCYVSNFLIKMPRGALVAIPSKGDVSLIVDGFPRDQPAIKCTTWIEDIRSCADISQACMAYLKERSPFPSTIGFVGLRQYMPYDEFRFLTQSLDQCKVVEVDHIISSMRMVKSERECDQMRRSSRIVNRAFEFLSNSMLPNLTERTLEATVDYVARMEGAEDVRILLAKPHEKNWALRIAENHVLSDGERIILYLSVAFERYWSECIKTLVYSSSTLTEPPDEKFGDLYDHILAKMIPGKALSLFYKEAVEEIQTSGMDFIPEYGIGQGIGLSLKEPPLISDSENRRFDKGMCFTLRLTSRDEKNGALMKGNTRK